MAITRNFKLFLNAGSQIPLVIHANQYDSGEQWRFTLYNQDGSVYEPSSGAIVGIKSDGHGIINTGTVSGGKVVITETQQMTAAAGKAVFELMIDGGSHGTANFMVLVEPKPGDQADLSESDLSLIQEAINSTTPANIASAVSTWMDDNLAPSEWVIDPSLSTSGAAADAKKTGDEISALKSALSISQIVSYVDFSDRETGYYLNTNCQKTARNGTFISAPVTVKKGQKVLLYIASYTSFCIIAKYNNGTYSPLLLGTATDFNTAYNYEYEITEDCQIVFSGYDRNNYHAEICLMVDSMFESQNAEITTIKNRLQREVDFSTVVTGEYVNFNGTIAQSNLCFRTPPIYMEHGETISVNVKSYNTQSTIALFDGTRYYPLVIGADTFVNEYRTYTFTAPYDCYVVVSGYIALPPYGHIEHVYSVQNLPFDNLLAGAGLASAYDTMGFIGDSISSGECYSNEGGTNVAHDIYSVSWGQYLAKMCGATGYNWSRGGQTSKTWIAEWSNNASFTDHPCKMYVIGLGQNDGYDLTDARAVPLGTTADVGTEAETFYGLYSKIIRRVKEIQPKAHIFVITNILQRIEDNGYNTAIRYMASYYDNVFLIDYYTYGQDALNSPLMLSQKRLGHYTALGYRLMAQYINTYIDWYMRNNPAKFSQIEFIGTEWSWT